MNFNDVGSELTFLLLQTNASSVPLHEWRSSTRTKRWGVAAEIMDVTPEGRIAIEQMKARRVST